MTKSWAQIAWNALYMLVGVRAGSRKGCMEEEALLLVVSDV